MMVYVERHWSASGDNGHSPASPLTNLERIKMRRNIITVTVERRKFLKFKSIMAEHGINIVDLGNSIVDRIINAKSKQEIESIMRGENDRKNYDSQEMVGK